MRIGAKRPGSNDAATAGMGETTKNAKVCKADGMAPSQTGREISTD